jgi:hypothetical protein
MNNGGPAFPYDPVTSRIGIHSGMTLRDWFAGMVIGHCFEALKHNAAPQGWESVCIGSSGLAYQVADAMLAERAKEQG